MKTLCAALSLLLLLSVSAEPEKLVFRAACFPPFLMNAHSAEPGFAVELIRAAVPPDLYEIKFEDDPQGTALFHLRDSAFQGAAGVSQVNVPGVIFCRIPLFRSGTAVCERTDSNRRFKNLESLEDARTLFSADSPLPNELAEFLDRHRGDGRAEVVTGRDAVLKNMRRLARHDCDFLIDQRDALSWALIKVCGGKSRKRDLFRIIPLSRQGIDYFLALNADDLRCAGFAKIFDERLEKFMKTPEYAKLRKKYGME